MASAELSTGDADLVQLDNFLASERTPEDCMRLPELDGFLTAVAIGPEQILPSEWLPVIWGNGEPAFASSAEAETIMGSIIGRYTEIVQTLQLAPDALEPLVGSTPEDKEPPDDWTEGFLVGVMLRLEAWQPLLDSAEDDRLLGVIFALAEGDSPSVVEAHRTVPTDFRRMMNDLIAPSVHAIYTFWSERRFGGSGSLATKTAWNSACPCGSGQEYGRCCGAR